MTPPKRRGRPVGTTPNREHDERLLRQAALRLFHGLSPNATAAFRSLLDEDNPHFGSILRRLQRHWQNHAERYLEQARRDAFSRRWQYEAKALAEALPELSRTIDTFFSSAIGKTVLLKYGKDGIPAEPMSLGMMRLWEEIVRHSAVGPIRAEELFDRAYSDWSATGLEPDEAFLRRFAELCLEQADRLNKYAAADPALRDSDAPGHQKGAC